MADALRSTARAQGIEPSDHAVASFLGSLESPRLAALTDALRQVAATPSVETLPDIEATREEPLLATAEARSDSTPVEAGARTVATGPRAWRLPVLAAIAAAVILGGVAVVTAMSAAGEDEPCHPLPSPR
jgi:hypothetical protein